jgi:hypothetical protein
MTRVYVASALLAMVVVCSCGGQVERDGGDSADPTTGVTADGGDKSQFDDTELGPCRRGRPPASDEPCPWLAEERCYLTKDEACACVCPPGAGTLCMSDFPDDTRPVEVSCF